MDKANILAIGAHPDDIEFGCGGALIKYTRKGHRLFLLIMTGGGMGGPRGSWKWGVLRSTVDPRVNTAVDS